MSKIVLDHFLVVTHWYFEHDRGTDVEVSHPAECKWIKGEMIGDLEFGGRYDCDVENHISYDGFENLTDEHGYDVILSHLQSGRYPIVWEVRNNFDVYGGRGEYETELWIVKSKRENA